jgi:hypothetical protein
MPTKEQFQALGRHLTTEASVAWKAAGAIFASVAVPSVFLGCSAATFTWAGLALQLFGLFLVAIGIDSSLRSFRQDSLVSRTSQWFVTLRVLAMTIVRRRPRPITGSAAITLSGTLRAHGHATAVLTSAPSTLEGRVLALEADLKNLRTALADHAETSRSEIRGIHAELAKSKEALAATEVRLESLVKEEATGDLHLELIGLITLFFGTLFAGIPDEVARVCHFLF